VGQWLNGKLEGQGTFTYSDGSVYIGQWKQNQRNGQGSFTRPNGSKYQGQWKNDAFEGQGIYLYADGSLYQGQWKNNRRNGAGTYTTSKGAKFQGQWKNGKLIGKGILITSDGQKYLGSFNKDGRLIGEYTPIVETQDSVATETKGKTELNIRRKAEATTADTEKKETAKMAETIARKETQTGDGGKAKTIIRRDSNSQSELKSKDEVKKTGSGVEKKVTPIAPLDSPTQIKTDAKIAKKAKAKPKAVIPAKTPTETDAKSQPDSVKKRFTAANGMTFVYIPPGRFKMGSPESESGRYDNEPQHQVTLSAGFYIQTTEVTQGQWSAIMGDNPSFFSGCGDDCPVEQVSWDDTQQFIWRLNQLEGANRYRLPTEAEWEYACRGGSISAFASGQISSLDCENDTKLAEVGWFCGNSAKTIHPVAQKKANAWGLYDMHGNVSELCRDWYGEYPPDQITDPKGPSSGIDRAVRGGGWDSKARHCRSACRGAVSSGQKINDVGFRLVRMP
jgi:formylglycine-generating enzyme required for sulfatase activity